MGSGIPPISPGRRFRSPAPLFKYYDITSLSVAKVNTDSTNSTNYTNEVLSSSMPDECLYTDFCILHAVCSRVLAVAMHPGNSGQ